MSLRQPSISVSGTVFFKLEPGSMPETSFEEVLKEPGPDQSPGGRAPLTVDIADSSSTLARSTPWLLLRANEHRGRALGAMLPGDGDLR